MNSKKFLVIFTSAPDTRWINDDEFVARQLQFIARSVAASMTLGPEPSAEVVVDEWQGELAL